MEEIVNDISKQTNLTMNSIISHPITYGLISILLAVYGPRLQPKLPPSLRNLFNNNTFRFLIILLISYITSKNLQLALIISIGFCLITSLSVSQDIEEKFMDKYSENYSNFDVLTSNNTPPNNTPPNNTPPNNTSIGMRGLENIKLQPIQITPIECKNGLNTGKCVDHCLSKKNATNEFCKMNFPPKNVMALCSNEKYNLIEKVNCLNRSCDYVPNNRINYCNILKES